MSEECLRKALRASYAVSFGFALVMAAAFFAAARFKLADNFFAAYGGATWVFVLSLIVALPIVTPAMKRRFRGWPTADEGAGTDAIEEHPS